MGNQPAVAVGTTAEQRAARHLAREPARRNPTLPGGRAAWLFRAGSEDDRGLDAGTALQGGARRGGRERLGRQDQRLRGYDRPGETGPLWTDDPQRDRRAE